MKTHPATRLTFLCLITLLFPSFAANPPTTRRLTTLQPATALSSPPRGPQKGTLLLCSIQTPEIRHEFIKRAGGPQAHFVLVRNVIAPDANFNLEAVKTAYSWGVSHMIVWHADDAKSAADPTFLSALKQADAVWFTGGYPDLYADPYLDSPAHQALADLLARGSIIGGESAGAMIQTSHLMNTNNQVHTTQPPPQCYRGFSFLTGAAIFPHFAAGRGKFPLADCQKLIAQTPHLLGIGLDDGAAILVTQDELQAIGSANVTLLCRSKNGQQSKNLKPQDKSPLAVETID